MCACVCVFVRVFLCGLDEIWKGTLLCVDVMKFGRVHFCVGTRCNLEGYTFVCGRDQNWKGTLLCVDVIEFGKVHFCVWT